MEFLSLRHERSEEKGLYSEVRKKVAIENVIYTEVIQGAVGNLLRSDN